jgi:hypothetical protein
MKMNNWTKCIQGRVKWKEVIEKANIFKQWSCSMMMMMMMMMKKKSILFYLSLYEKAESLYIEDRERIGWENKVLKTKCFLSQAIAAVQNIRSYFHSYVQSVIRKTKVSGLKTGALLQLRAGKANRPDEVSASLLPNGYRREGFSCKLRRPDLKTSNFYRSKSSCTWLQWKHYLICRGYVSVTSGR